MRDLLVICPTRSRPERFKKMEKSFLETSENAKLCAVLDFNDPKLNEYYKTITKNRVFFNLRGRETITNHINWAYKVFPGYKFYSVTNDDFVYKTPGWDETLMKEGWITYGNDLCAREKMPTSWVVDAEIVRAVGWLQYPKLEGLYGDAVWKMIGHKTNRLKYFKDVIIEHEHFLNKKAEKDAIYEETNSKERYRKDHEVFRGYVSGEMDEDIKKIKKFL